MEDMNYILKAKVNLGILILDLHVGHVGGEVQKNI